MPRRQTVDPLIRAQVIAAWGNQCWLGMPGCRITATEDDHIIPYAHGGKDTVTNLRRACKHCNAARQDRVLSGYGATLHAVIGPPRADFTGYLTGLVSRDSVVVSFDSLIRDIYPLPDPPDGVRLAAAMAWDGAYRALAKCGQPLDIWLVRTLPRSRRHPDMLGEWLALDYDIHVVETPADATFDLDLTPREYRAAQQWYAMRITQRMVDARALQRRQRLASLGLRASDGRSAGRPAW